jgi:DNA-binding protein YbaB
MPADPIRFEMNPKEDLSARPDFTFDLMQSISKEAQGAVDSSPEITAIKQKASVRVGTRGTLASIEIVVDVIPREGVELGADEIEAARSAASSRIRETIGSRMGALIQGSIDSARGRM